MRTYLAVLLLLLLHRSAQAQYDKAKLTALLVSHPWSVQSSVSRPEKKMVFSSDQQVLVDRDNGKGSVAQAREKWSLSTSDDIRWFLTIGTRTYELIVSYSKSGSQYLKLTHLSEKDRITGYYEMNLHATR